METHEHDPVWELSPHTRELGRKAIADVRSILRSARHDVDDSDHLSEESEAAPKAA